MVNLMVSGGFDMSVGSVVAFTGAVTAMMLRSGVPVPLSVFVGLVIGGGIGLFNGFIVAKVGINPFVTTLSSLSLFRGLTLIVTRGQNIAGLPGAFKLIGQAKLLGVQTPIIIAVVLLIYRRCTAQEEQVSSGRVTTSEGTSRRLALSGIPVDKMKILGYMLTGLFAAISGIVMTARLGAASVTGGTGMELRVITAVIIGGASLNGGEGSVLGAFLGTLLMAIITNALTLLGVDVYWQTFVIGGTLLLAVLIDTLGKRNR